MDIKTKEIIVNKESNTATIDASDNRYVYIVENGKVEAIPLPAFGTIELPCQNYKIGNPSIKATIKRK